MRRNDLEKTSMSSLMFFIGVCGVGMNNRPF